MISNLDILIEKIIAYYLTLTQNNNDEKKFNIILDNLNIILIRLINKIKITSSNELLLNQENLMRLQVVMIDLLNILEKEVAISYLKCHQLHNNSLLNSNNDDFIQLYDIYIKKDLINRDILRSNTPYKTLIINNMELNYNNIEDLFSHVEKTNYEDKNIFIEYVKNDDRIDKCYLYNDFNCLDNSYNDNMTTIKNDFLNKNRKNRG